MNGWFWSWCRDRKHWIFQCAIRLDCKPAFGHVPLPTHGIFLYFQPFRPVFSWWLIFKMILKSRVSPFQSSLEMSRLCLEWGVNPLLAMCHCQDMAFSTIFSHISQFLAKMADSRWYWSPECSLFQSSIEMSRLWLEWGVNQRLALCHCQDMAFSSIFSHFSQFLAKMADFEGDSEVEKFPSFHFQ